MKRIFDICKNIKPIHIHNYSSLINYTAFLNGYVFFLDNNLPCFKKVDLLFYNTLRTNVCQQKHKK